jgi:hypothetical protein
MWHGPCLETVNEQSFYASVNLNNTLLRVGTAFTCTLIINLLITTLIKGDCVLLRAKDDSQSATLGRIKIFYEKLSQKYVSFWRLTPARLFKGLNTSGNKYFHYFDFFKIQPLGPDAKELVTSNEVEDDLIANIVDKKHVISRAQHMIQGQSAENQMYHTSKIKLPDKIQLMKTQHKTKLTSYGRHVHEFVVTADDFQAVYAFISATGSNPMHFSEWNKRRSAWINMELIKQHHTNFVNSLGKSLWEFTQAFEVHLHQDTKCANVHMQLINTSPHY